MSDRALALPVRLRRDRTFWRGTFVAMANACEVLCETTDEKAARAISEAAAAEALRIERKFSRYRDDSVVHAIHASHGAGIVLDEETSQLVDYAATLWQLSDGAFDITSGALRYAWRFSEPQNRPTAEAIRELLERVGWQRVRWARPAFTLPDGMEIDFGGIGKEYAVDRTVALLGESLDVPTLVNFGGDLRTAGPTPAAGAWQVGIESIAAAGEADKLIKLATGALATSGDTHRFVEIDGRRYGHIFDARTGWPTPDAPRSVTVAADTCSQAGTFTTLAMLQGRDAETFLELEDVRYWCLR